MNKKNFVILTAALTGMVTVGVGTVAISGANQINNYSSLLRADEKLYINDFSKPGPS